MSLIAFLILLAFAIWAEPHVPRALAAIGLSRWRFYHRPIDKGAYALFLAATSAIVGTLVLLYFTVGSAALSQVEEPRRATAFRRFYESWWIVWPLVLECVTMELLCFAGVGESPGLVALPMIAALSTISLFAFGQLAHLLRAAILVPDQRGRGNPVKTESLTARTTGADKRDILPVLAAIAVGFYLYSRGKGEKA